MVYKIFKGHQIQKTWKTHQWTRNNREKKRSGHIIKKKCWVEHIYECLEKKLEMSWVGHNAIQIHPFQKERVKHKIMD